MLVIFNQIYCVLILLMFCQKIDFNDNFSKSHTQHRHSCREKKSGGRGVHFLVIYRANCNLSNMRNQILNQ